MPKQRLQLVDDIDYSVEQEMEMEMMRGEGEGVEKTLAANAIKHAVY